MLNLVNFAVKKDNSVPAANIKRWASTELASAGFFALAEGGASPAASTAPAGFSADHSASPFDADGTRVLVSEVECFEPQCVPLMPCVPGGWQQCGRLSRGRARVRRHAQPARSLL